MLNQLNALVINANVENFLIFMRVVNLRGLFLRTKEEKIILKILKMSLCGIFIQDRLHYTELFY